jgi:hypothetical protein
MTTLRIIPAVHNWSSLQTGTFMETVGIEPTRCSPRDFTPTLRKKHPARRDKYGAPLISGGAG